MDKEKIYALILAGGQAKRMGGKAKNFIEVGRRKIIDRQLEWIREFGIPVEKVIVSIGHRVSELSEYLARKIKPDNVFFDPGSKKIGDGGAIRAAFLLKEDAEYLLSVNCDLLLLFDPKKFRDFVDEMMEKQDKDGIIVVKPFRTHLGIMTISGFGITSFKEKPVLEGYYSSCGVYFLHRRVVDYLPAEGSFAKECLEKKYERFIVYPIEDNEWCAVETYKDIEVAEKLLEVKKHALH